MLSSVLGQPKRLRFANNPDLLTRSKLWSGLCTPRVDDAATRSIFPEVVLVGTQHQCLSAMHGKHCPADLVCDNMQPRKKHAG